MMNKQSAEIMMTGALTDTLRGGNEDEVMAFVEEITDALYFRRRYRVAVREMMF